MHCTTDQVNVRILGLLRLSVLWISVRNSEIKDSCRLRRSCTSLTTFDWIVIEHDVVSGIHTELQDLPLGAISVVLAAVPTGEIASLVATPTPNQASRARARSLAVAEKCRGRRRVHKGRYRGLRGLFPRKGVRIPSRRIRRRRTSFLLSLT